MYRIVSKIPRPERAVLERAKSAKVGVSGMFAGLRQCADPAIKPLETRWTVSGVALTVRPEKVADLAAVALALKYTEPGDVIVVDAGGQIGEACWGAGLTRNAKQVGCAGVVIDGAATDGWRLREWDLPVFCRGMRAGGTHPVESPGSINVPINCGGVTVYPGDIVLGDADGVVFLPRDEADAIMAKAEEYMANAAKHAAASSMYYQDHNVEEKFRKLTSISWE